MARPSKAMSAASPDAGQGFQPVAAARRGRRSRPPGRQASALRGRHCDEKRPATCHDDPLARHDAPADFRSGPWRRQARSRPASVQFANGTTRSCAPVAAIRRGASEGHVAVAARWHRPGSARRPTRSCVRNANAVNPTPQGGAISACRAAACLRRGRLRPRPSSGLPDLSARIRPSSSSSTATLKDRLATPRQWPHRRRRARRRARSDRDSRAGAPQFDLHSRAHAE